MKQALGKFQQISQGQAKDQKLEVLKAIYDDTMKRIKEQKPGFRHLATSALSWLSHAKRQLKTRELQHALAMNLDLDSGSVPQKFDDDGIPEIDLIVSSCHGLVTVDEESDVIRLVHYTTQEYFGRIRKEWFPDAETEITNVCTLYLTISGFVNKWELGAYPDLERDLQREPFYGYACMYWGYHARGTDYSSQIIHNFLTNAKKLAIAANAMCHIHFHEENNKPFLLFSTALDLAAFFGAIDLIKKMSDIQNTPLGTAYLGNALFGALWNEQMGAFQLLLDMGADVNATGEYKPTPLHLAAEMGNTDAVRILLQLGADTHVAGRYYDTPLLSAAIGGHVALARLLLENDASTTTTTTLDENTEYVVDCMMWDANEAMIRLFLEKITRPKQKVYHLKNEMLCAAIEYSFIEAIEIVFEKGPRPKIKGRFGSKLLYDALTRYKTAGAVELLLEKGAKPMQEGRFGKERILRETKLDKEWLAQTIPSLFTK